MRVEPVWVGLGAGGGLLVAALISAVLQGPGWPYFLVLGMGCLVAALAFGLRGPAGDA